MIRKNNRHDGFTLVEMIIVMVIMAIIAKMSSGLLYEGLNAYLAGNNVMETDWQAQLVLQRMSRDLRQIRSPTDLIAAGANTITFIDNYNYNVSSQITAIPTYLIYSLTGTSLNLSVQTVGPPPTYTGVTPISSASVQTLANNINSITFSYYNSAGAALTPLPLSASNLLLVSFITVTIVVKSGTSLTYTTTIAPRNLA